MTKIIFSLFTTANYIPNLAPHLLMAFNELEKQKFSKFQKNNILTCAPTLSKNSMEPPLSLQTRRPHEMNSFNLSWHFTAG